MKNVIRIFIFSFIIVISLQLPAQEKIGKLKVNRGGARSARKQISHFDNPKRPSKELLSNGTSWSIYRYKLLMNKDNKNEFKVNKPGFDIE